MGNRHDFYSTCNIHKTNTSKYYIIFLFIWQEGIYEIERSFCSNQIQSKKGVVLLGVRALILEHMDKQRPAIIITKDKIFKDNANIPSQSKYIWQDILTPKEQFQQLRFLHEADQLPNLKAICQPSLPFKQSYMNRWSMLNI